MRPKDDRQPRIIGAVYIDRDDAQVVRMAFNFTRAAFLDKQLEDLFVVLENGLIDGRFWLPRRQEIEIRRGGTWLDYPVRGIIRGRWEIGDYAGEHGPLARDVQRSGDRARAESRSATRCASAGASSTRFRPTSAPSPTPTCGACRRRRARSCARRRSAARRR